MTIKWNENAKQKLLFAWKFNLFSIFEFELMQPMQPMQPMQLQAPRSVQHYFGLGNDLEVHFLIYFHCVRPLINEDGEITSFVRRQALVTNS